MHLSSDYGVAELVDELDQPVAPGQSGQLLCTGLLNFGQVLIRYRVEDSATLDPEPCPCGSPLPVLASIDGRTGDMFLTRDGRRLGRLGDVLKGVECVAEWQLVQETLEHFLLQVVPAPGYADEHSTLIRRDLQEDLGDVRIDVVTVDVIEQGPGGKRPLFVSKVSPGMGDAASAVTREVLGG